MIYFYDAKVLEHFLQQRYYLECDRVSLICIAFFYLVNIQMQKLIFGINQIPFRGIIAELII